MKCEFLFFSFFLAISVIDQTPFFNSTLNLTNSTAWVFTIKSSVGIDFVGECEGIVTAMTLFSVYKLVKSTKIEKLFVDFDRKNE